VDSKPKTYIYVDRAAMARGAPAIVVHPDNGSQPQYARVVELHGPSVVIQELDNALPFPDPKPDVRIAIMTEGNVTYTK
jgi:hypothetical protein